jgi:glycosyltransferase involved in cell wall biosynthesis
MLHILEIPSWYKSNEHPFSATYNEDHARMLISNGLKVGVLFPNYSGSFIKRLKLNYNKTKTYYDNGIPTKEIKLHPYIPFLTKINYDLLFSYVCKSYDDYVRENGTPDLIHCHHCFMGGYIAMLLKKKYNIKYVLTKLSTPFIYEPEKLTLFEKQNISKIINLADAVIFISEFQKNKMYEIYNIKAKSSHNVIYLPLHDVFLDCDFNNHTSKIKFINIGNLIDTKNQETLIKAFYEFQKKHPNSELKIYGKGYLKQNLEFLIKQLALESKVVLMGEVNRTQIKNAIAESTFLISSSKQETMGVNLIEAHSQGIPVIALYAGTTQELINKENGVHIVSTTANDLCKGMLDAIKISFDSNVIRDKCLAKFSSSVIFNQTLKLYNKILCQ